MKAEKKVAKKEVKKVVEMISYSIRMTIPTGQYANIIPEIVVKAQNPEEAHAYITPHMNKLWKEYFMIAERKKEVVKPVEETTVSIGSVPFVPLPVDNPPVAVDGKTYNQTGYKAPPVTPSPIADVAIVKATQAIQSCMSTEALDLIIKQIGLSTKLTAENKDSLLEVIEERSKQLNGEA